VSCLFPTEVLASSGSTGFISAFPDYSGRAPRQVLRMVNQKGFFTQASSGTMVYYFFSKHAGSIRFMANKKDDSEEDEFALFREEMRDATRIRQNRLIHNKPKPAAKAIRQKIMDDEYQGETFSDMFSPETVGNEEYLEYRGPGIQHKLFGKLRNGKVHIEAELDLHGMTIAKAEPSLSEFLEFCQQQQIRCVRIIHGKGWGSRDNKPVLKSKLNHWLRQSEIVLAFCSATVDDGGTGALYVLLKRLFQE